MARLAALILMAVVAAAGITVAGVAVRDAGTVSISADGATPNTSCPSCV
jgi:hypothetical protein